MSCALLADLALLLVLHALHIHSRSLFIPSYLFHDVTGPCVFDDVTEEAKMTSEVLRIQSLLTNMARRQHWNPDSIRLFKHLVYREQYMLSKLTALTGIYPHSLTQTKSWADTAPFPVCQLRVCTNCSGVSLVHSSGDNSRCAWVYPHALQEDWQAIDWEVLPCRCWVRIHFLVK